MAKDKLCLELNQCFDVDYLYVSDSTGNSDVNVDGITFVYAVLKSELQSADRKSVV